ncbi:hypothetical protein BX616_010163 [Lobosporangium transversale]|uniref:Uncharacterized protein n=1 Tax=Lobosporangium transversale TaxID=64571 RepID=A0A1Y2GNS6_9FUNG|nr:hypothetical protein BCR41DRAFT_353234 [Lobosporangium transversale]KAF9913207.1 hypothetical protein BX616_010163 [Lobosporangium transversale]ORZ16821.1 hypothetical protein BCR41DRAFT_353234 [Lobosporangium transversale]|eukprot:XP_021881756.1 hypothetical protein BCR41DRAFT_353234 [Lobosporangium transversale]
MRRIGIFARTGSFYSIPITRTLGTTRHVHFAGVTVSLGRQQQQQQQQRSYSCADGKSDASVSNEPECPELPSTPSWSLKTLMEKRDAFNTTDDHSNDITPETIDRLLKLAHLCKPQDPKELKRLERDVRRMRNFLNYIRSTDGSQHNQTTPVENLRSLVDDGVGLRLRPSPVSSTSESLHPHGSHNAHNDEENEQELLTRRDMLLKRPKRVKGNFFVVGTELDPKEDN